MAKMCMCCFPGMSTEVEVANQLLILCDQEPIWMFKDAMVHFILPTFYDS